MRRLSRVACGVVAVGLGMLTACGGDSTGPNAQLSQAEAQTIANALFVEISRALASATPVFSDRAPSASAAIVPTTLNYSVSGNCSAGGTVTGTYRYITDFDGTGSGSASGSAVTTISQCAVSTGTRTIAINGNLTYSWSGSYANGRQSTNFVWTATGNYTWSGGSCSLDYSITVTPQGQTSFSGSICGVSINGSSG